jgi:uncharacterized protein with FMN-binding domain
LIVRRATAVVLGTLTGTALIVGAKVGTPSQESQAADTTDASAVTVDGGDNPGTDPQSNGKTQIKPGATPTPTASKKAAPTSGPPKTTKSAPKTTAAAPPPPSGPDDGTYNASAQVKNGSYGTLSMTVTISGGKITKISASESGGESSCWHSACPTLTSEALNAQSANIATVSRATYTSNAYRSALSAVLSKANG